MNFLAHIYLSGNNKLITIGNFVADGIRGKNYRTYPKEMQIGILLHREIDTFTDAHHIFRQSTKRLHQNYGHYSGVIVDIFYDHFLAKNWESYSHVPLAKFVDDFYQTLNANFDMLPERFKRLTPIMIKGNWLFNYATIDGIQSVLNGMNNRTNGKSKMNKATTELRVFYSEFEREFIAFFEELRTHSNSKLIEIKKQFEL